MMTNLIRVLQSKGLSFSIKRWQSEIRPINFKRLLILTSLLILTACGGGGGGGGSSATAGSSAVTMDFSNVSQLATAQTASCGISVSNFTPTIGAWWVSGSFTLANNCSTSQSVSGLQLILSANQALTANNFSLNNVSYPKWESTTASTIGVVGNTAALQITLNTVGTIPANGTATGSFGYNPGGTILSGLTMQVNGSTPIGNATLKATINSSGLSSVCIGATSCSIPVQLLGQGGTLYKTVATVTNSNLSNSTVTLTNLIPGSYIIATGSLPNGVAESTTPSTVVTLTANTTSSVTLTFTAQTANVGNLSFTLINPDVATFSESNLAVSVKSSVSGRTMITQANFASLTTLTGLVAESYTLTIPGLASASKGQYYAYANKLVIVPGNNATIALGNITAVTNSNTIADTITVNGLAIGDSITFAFTDSINGNSYIFNAESITATSANSLVKTYKFIKGDTVTVNIAVNNKYQSVAPFNFTQGASAQGFIITLTQAPVVTSGILYFHAYVPQTSSSAFSDSMLLTGDNYTDLIMSNYIAGVMLGHTIIEQFPGIQFNKDYMYGTILGQLLQENIETELYESTTNLIDPSSLQAAVMGAGQGGPYQINSYAYDMVGQSAGGYALANYVAIQKNIGYTLSQQSSQASSATPAVFNDKYYGPMLTAYFHLNDLRALETLENGSAGYIASAAPNYVKCMANLVGIANNPLEIIMNYAYNQGFFGGLVGSSTTDCVNSTASALLAKYNSYSNASGSSYNEYPYQVRFYLDELYNQSTLIPATNNHVAFAMPKLATVFANVFQTLAYVDSLGNYNYITQAQANTAFNQALVKLNVAGNATLDLSNSTQRPVIYSILETAISNLESSVGTNFSATTLTQLAATGNNESGGGSLTPVCPASPVMYPAGIGTYVGGTIVQGTDGSLYQCISNTVGPWCNNSTVAGKAAYAPGTGSAWTSAWTLYSCTK